MDVRISNISEFINCIHDYIIDEYEITPRDFETKLVTGDKSLIWYEQTNKIEPFDCYKFNGCLHVHNYGRHGEEKDSAIVICCSEVDIIALKYLYGSIFGPLKSKIISSLHSWLPAATFQFVRVSLKRQCNIVDSYLEPSYVFHILESIDFVSPLQYNYYIDSNIVLYKSYNLIENNKEIMVRRRSRSRSRSRSMSPSRSSSRSGGGRRRSRAGRPSNVGRPRNSSTRRRSRSRSRSRSSSRRY